MKFINKLFCKISSIYKNDIIFFTIIFILLFITDAYFNIKSNQYNSCIYTLIYAYAISSTICLIYSYVDRYKYFRKAIDIITIFFFCIYNTINAFSIFLTLKPLNGGTIEIILSTNYNETIEFFHSFISAQHLLLALSAITGFIILSLKKIQIKKEWSNYILSLLYILSIFSIIIGDYDTLNTPLGRLYNIYKVKHLIELTPNLDLYKSNPNFVETTEAHPENIVIILGESFAKTHSSLYGYEKNTNPSLYTHQKDSNLHIFNNTTSPATHTLAAFKAIMGTFSYNRECKEWYKHTTIPECLSLLGYKTIWISNQEQYGIRDNIPTRFAQLCDTVLFTQKKTSDKFNDEEILNYIDENPLKKELFILHLMGQHPQYSERYPDKFNVFKEDEYLYLPQNQRKKVSEYDNATLYNDFVIDSIIHIFSKKEAIILYFSDHGQDIYFSDKDYCGHGITANAKSDSIGRDIPFMIYTSPKFKDKYPSLIEKIQNSTNKKFNIEDIIYTLIDISGYKFKDNNDVEKYSILSN